MVAAGAEVAAAGSEEAGVAAASAEEVAEASTGAAGGLEDGAEAEGDKFCCCLSDVIFFSEENNFNKHGAETREKEIVQKFVGNEVYEAHQRED